MKKFWFCFSFLLLLTACRQTPKNNNGPGKNLEKIDLTDHWANPQEVKLSSIADSIFYIPLETTSKAFISGDNAHLIRVEYLNKYLAVYEENKTLRLFNRTGKFLLTFGGQGKGPGEYIEARDFVCDESENRVYVLDGNQSKIIVFDFTGKLIKEIKTQKWPCEITVSPDHKIGIVYLSLGNPRDTARLEWLTPEGAMKQKIPLYQNRLYAKTATWGQTALYWIDRRLRITEPPFDTIHQLDPEMGFKGVTSIIAGPEGIPREIWFNSVRWGREAWNYLIVRRIFENSDCVFIESEGKKFCNFLHDKATGQTVRVKSEQGSDRDFDGLHNDVDGGLPFWPRTGSSDYLLTCISYGDIKSYFKGRSMKETDSTVNLFLHKRFISIANGLKEDDNPVVVVVRMKK
jgi:hypothetical protein